MMICEPQPQSNGTAHADQPNATAPNGSVEKAPPVIPRFRSHMSYLRKGLAEDKPQVYRKAIGFLSSLPEGVTESQARNIYVELTDLEGNSTDTWNVRAAFADFVKSRNWKTALDEHFYKSARRESDDRIRERELLYDLSDVSLKIEEEDGPIIEGVIAAHQSAVFAGPFKGCKTLLAIQAAVCVGNGVPFLGHNVPYKLRVGVFLGESAYDWATKAAERAAASIGGNLSCVNIFTKLPNLSAKKNRADINFLAERKRWDLLVIDPLYKAVGGKADISSIYSMSAHLRAISEEITGYGCTTLFVHHATRAIVPGKPMELGDMLGAGVAEFFRSWVLINRATPFDPARPGRHELIVSTGTCQGHAGVQRVDVNEGLDGSPYSINHKPYDPDQQATGKPRQRRARQTAEAPRGDNEKRVLDALRRLASKPGENVPRTKLRNDLGMNGTVLSKAIASLASAGKVKVEVEEFEYKGATRERHFVRAVCP